MHPDSPQTPLRQLQNSELGYTDTPTLPDSGYLVHDGTRPQPPIVTPGDAPFAPPSDAMVLFDGTDLDQWESIEGGPAPWVLGDGWMEVLPKSKNIRTKSHFGRIQLHIEFSAPTIGTDKPGQARGNSGIFLMGLYEVQVLDNYQNPTYADGTVGAIYGQIPPLVNAIRPPGEWNHYDILWEPPLFEGETLLAPPRITVLLNNIVLHHAKPLLGPTQFRKVAAIEPHGPVGPIILQDHGDPVRFRNIWVREIGHYDD